jgi:2-polyprenyl-6-methoxyphenol hydroxylase-like FAD-dependent oxidoreductase
MDSIFSSGSRVHHLIGQTTAGRKVLDLDYRLLDPRLFGLGLYRGTIFTQLLEKMQAEDIPIRPGVEIVDYESVGSQVSSKTGSKPVVLTTASGEQLGPYDMVIVAEGARSALRAKRHQKWFKCARHYRWGTLWSIVPDTTGIYHASGTLNQYFEGTSKMMGILPTGYRPHEDGQTPLVTMFWSLHRDQYDAWKQRDFEDWRSEVSRMTPLAQPLLNEIRSRDQVTFATYYDVRMWPYHNPVENNVVYIGDSAHAMSPVLGQGVNLALNDAWVLSESIQKQGNLVEALNRYSNTRMSTLYYYQTMSMLLNPWFQSSRIPGFAFTRDRLFAAGAHIPSSLTGTI